MTAEIKLASEIARRLAEVGIDAVVTVESGVVHLLGIVEGQEKEDAEAIVSEMAPGLKIDNALEILPVVEVPDDPPRPTEDEMLLDALEALEPDVGEDAVMVHEASQAGEPTPAGDDITVEPYFPPTDPVVRLGPHGLEVLGGFGETSVDEVTENPRVPGWMRSDEEIAEDVRRELAEDAMTANLAIQVVVVQGVVHLHGRVSSLEEIEAVEEVAGRVPGVVEVHEDLEL